MREFWLICLFLLVTGSIPAEGRKVRNTFRIEKETSKPKANKAEIPGYRIALTEAGGSDTSEEKKKLTDELGECTFSGYDKELNSSKESFLLTNRSSKVITGFVVRIDYQDMEGRMLHSRLIEESCVLPPGETRRFDIKSWDSQHTYYYFLGNEPKKVATPYKVAFLPQVFWVEM